jgi:DNA processing protein
VRPDPRGWPPSFGRDSSERDALIVLAHLETMTPRRLRDLAWSEGSAVGCLEAVRSGAAGDRDRELADRVDVPAVRDRVASGEARLIAPRDREYPTRLLGLADPPGWLFAKGRSLEEHPTAVAVVGARSCSAYGHEIGEAIGRGIAARGVTVVSGAARGVDSAAHRGALAVGGPTLAVLGCGIDVAYPAGNRGLIDRIAQEGTVVSEYPPGAPALPRRFPARNRLIAALGRAVVVVEGAAGSGSLITAEFALDLGYEVLAVPGLVTSPLSAAPHDLLREGATLVRGPEDVLEAVGIHPDETGNSGGGEGVLSADERRVLDEVVGEPITAETVAHRAGLRINTALSLLMSLQMRGLLRGSAGRYQRTSSVAATHTSRTTR